MVFQHDHPNPLDVACPGDPDRKATGRRKTVKGLIAANDFLVLRSEEQGRRHRTAILAVGFRNARSRMPCVEGPVVLLFCSSKLAHS
jgi:hypothetical protein